MPGIDAPEKGQPYGQAAKEYLSSNIFNRDVLVVPRDTHLQEQVFSIRGCLDLVTPGTIRNTTHQVYTEEWSSQREESAKGCGLMKILLHLGNIG